ncbi:hypothetical protein ACJX0J_020090, partial [Zea mays]
FLEDNHGLAIGSDNEKNHFLSQYLLLYKPISSTTDGEALGDSLQRVLCFVVWFSPRFESYFNGAFQPTISISVLDPLCLF